MIDDSQIYIVVDIEADGPMPGAQSMLSLAAVATTPDKEVGRFYRKLVPLKDAIPDPRTLEWWKGQPEAWTEVNTDPETPESVMQDFCLWVDSFGAEAIFVSSPIALDYGFVHWYLHTFAHENPFANENNAVRTLDIRSFIAGKYSLSYNKSSRTKLPTKLTADMPEHTHKAIDDAVGYGILLRKILRDD